MALGAGLISVGQKRPRSRRSLFFSSLGENNRIKGFLPIRRNIKFVVGLFEPPLHKTFMKSKMGFGWGVVSSVKFWSFSHIRMGGPRLMVKV